MKRTGIEVLGRRTKTIFARIMGGILRNMEEFKLERNEFIELNDFMKLTGICGSGGMAKTMIKEGKVMVDGKVELRRRCKIRTGQIVIVENREILVV